MGWVGVMYVRTKVPILRPTLNVKCSQCELNGRGVRGAGWCCFRY